MTYKIISHTSKKIYSDKGMRPWNLDAIAFLDLPQHLKVGIVGSRSKQYADYLYEKFPVREEFGYILTLLHDRMVAEGELHVYSTSAYKKYIIEGLEIFFNEHGQELSEMANYYREKPQLTQEEPDAAAALPVNESNKAVPDLEYPVSSFEN